MESEKSKEIKPNKKCCSGGNVFLAIVLVSIGLILLLNNFGLISWEVWQILWKFWPVILIFWGIEAIAGKNIFSEMFIVLIGIIIALLVITYSVSLVDSGFDKWVRRNIPVWGQIKKNLPQKPSQDTLFECSPFDENCYRFFSN